jgi:hypothetical protein
MLPVSGGEFGGRRPKLRPNQQDEIVAMVLAGTKTAADAARLFAVHPATISRLLARAGAGTGRRCDALPVVRGRSVLVGSEESP